MRAVLLVACLAVVPGAWAVEKGEGEAKSDPALYPQLKMVTTMGDIVLELNGEKAPISVRNFVQYAEDGFYNETIFHRVIDKFMIQAGGFTATFEKKSGLRPPIKNEWRNGLKNSQGTIAMARTSMPDSATAQFYINVVDNRSLDRPRGGAAYAVFGKVVEGMDVVDKIKKVKVHPNPKAGQHVPVETIAIKSVTLLNGLTLKKVVAAIKKQEETAVMAKTELAKAFESLVTDGHDAQNRQLQQTESGLMYVILKEGNGPSPQPTDTVKVHYTGWLMDGTKFDSSVDRGQPASFGLNRVIAGWTEGVGLMKAGEKRRFVIPSDLGYGKRGSPPNIPPDATLVFDVELLEIK
ncbi:MAG: peptidylprolyl isomerase [Phycisphaerae bacterium]|nr:peptidylprolyl isomerase [Phycisphaerae bacterium]